MLTLGHWRLLGKKEPVPVSGISGTVCRLGEERWGGGMIRGAKNVSTGKQDVFELLNTLELYNYAG